MPSETFVFIWIAVAIAGTYLYGRMRFKRRERFIDGYGFAERLDKKLTLKYPDMTQDQRNLVLIGLRDYMHVCRMAGKRVVSMPSQAVDEAWHEFILFTREYREFCQKAFGRFLHHTPAEAMETKTTAQAGIKRAWMLSCRRDHINPRSPGRLPLLFALDGMLGIKNGFIYSLNCMAAMAGAQGAAAGDFCASHIGCSSGCGTGCSADSSADSSDGGDGGCGGD